MHNVGPVRLSIMVLLAIPALLLGFMPLALSLIALIDLAHWSVYVAGYVSSGIVATSLTVAVYVVKYFHV